MSHQVFSNFNMRVELDQQEGQGFIDYGCELISVDTEMLKELKHELERDCPEKALPVTATPL